MSTAMTDPDGAAMTDKKLREAVIAGCRELVQRGLTYRHLRQCQRAPG